MTKRLKNATNKNVLSLLSFVWVHILILLADKGEIFYPTDSSGSQQSYSVLKTKGRRIYTLVFLLKREIKKKFTSTID